MTLTLKMSLCQILKNTLEFKTCNANHSAKLSLLKNVEKPNCNERPTAPNKTNLHKMTPNKNLSLNENLENTRESRNGNVKLITKMSSLKILCTKNLAGKQK